MYLTPNTQNLFLHHPKPNYFPLFPFGAPISVPPIKPATFNEREEVVDVEKVDDKKSSKEVQKVVQ